MNVKYLKLLNQCKNLFFHRNFLSNAYYCNEVWNSRLTSPILQKINLDELYSELDGRFIKYRSISAIDVDIFANSMQDANHLDELLDLIHKLRLSADTSNSLPSTEHAVVRNLLQLEEHDRLLQVLDDRLNYGVFLDSYTANLLLDTFWKKNDYCSGARTASQIMLQEDFTHPLTTYLSLLHCYKFLQKPEGWTEPAPPEESEEEIKVRVKYIRNPFFDDHFDLRNPLQIVGKIFAMAGKTLENSLRRTFELVGLTLQNKLDKAKDLLQTLQNETLVSEVLNLLPEDNEVRVQAQSINTKSMNVVEELERKVKEAERNYAERDISEQCKLYEEWIELRQKRLDEQEKRLEVAERLAKIEDSQKKLKEKELQLWFFDREEQLELDIEAKKVYYPKRWFGKKKKPRQINENYVPPEVKAAHNKNQ